MGRKRKAQQTDMDDKEVNNACLVTIEEEIHPHTTKHSYSNGLPPKKTKPNITNGLVRRSIRLKNSLASSGTQKTESAIEHVNLVESENESVESENKSNHHEEGLSPVPCEENPERESPPPKQYNNGPVGSERNLDEKLDYLVQAVDEFKAKICKQGTTRQTESSSNDVSYKSLYINSQKKIEALLEEHYELVKKLEFAHGQIAVYERMSNIGAASFPHPIAQRCISAAADENASPKPNIDCEVAPKQTRKSNRRK